MFWLLVCQFFKCILLDLNRICGLSFISEINSVILGFLERFTFTQKDIQSVKGNATFVWNSTVKLIPSHCLTKCPMVNIVSVCRWAQCHFHNPKAVLAFQQTNFKHNVLAKYTTSAVTIELLCLPSWFCLVTEICTVDHSSKFSVQFLADRWLGWVWDWDGVHRFCYSVCFCLESNWTWRSKMYQKCNFFYYSDRNERQIWVIFRNLGY